MRYRIRTRAALIAGAAFAFSGIALAVPPHFVLVEPLEGHNWTSVYSVTADGLLATGLSQSPRGAVPFFWSVESGRADFITGYDGTFLVAVSEDRSVIAAMFWRNGERATLLYLGPIEGPYTGLSNTEEFSYNPLGMSGDGSVVYGVRSPSGTGLGESRPFIWRGGDSAPELPNVTTSYDTIGGGPNASSCMDYSGSQLVGMLGNNEYGIFLGVVWEGDTVSVLPGLPDDPVQMGYVAGISRNGRYISGMYYDWGAIWDNRVLTTIFPPIYLYTYPVMKAVADHGRLAVSDDQIWTRERGLEDATVFLAAHGAPITEGWGFYHFNSISADGSVLVGTLYRDSPRIYRGFIAYTSYSPCFADFNEDGGVEGRDVEDFFLAWQASEERADVNIDGGVDGADIETFFTQWARGGCAQ